MTRVVIQWTSCAKRCLAQLPHKVRKGLLEKADRLAECGDPRKVFKALQGPLKGYYRLTYSRYRAVYSVDEEELADGTVLICFRVRFVVAGIRKEGDKNDVYNFALRMLNLGVIDDSPEDKESAES